MPALELPSFGLNKPSALPPHAAKENAPNAPATNATLRIEGRRIMCLAQILAEIRMVQRF
jgi:hypothetical protein